MSSTIARFRSRVQLTAAALLMPLVMAGGAVAQAESVVENVRFSGDGMALVAPKVIVRGSRLSQAELSRLLDPGSNEDWAARAVRLNADEIMLPEFTITMKAQHIEQHTTYRDVVLKRVGEGRVSSLTVRDGTLKGTQAGKEVSGSTGAMSVNDLDIGAAFSLLNAKAGPNEPLKRIYRDFSSDDFKMVDAEGLTFTIGRMAGKEFFAKPTTLGWSGTLSALSALENGKEPSRVLRTGLGGIVELLEAMSYGGGEISDVSMKGRVKTDDAETSAVDLDFSLRRAAYTAPSAGKGGEIKIEDLKFRSGDVRVSYGTMSYGGIDGKPVLDLLRELAAGSELDSTALVRRVLPVISSIRLENLEVEAPATGTSPSRAAAASPTRVGIGRFEVLNEKPINGIPTNLRITMRNLSMQVPPNPSDENLLKLLELGYDKVDGSYGLDLGWNEAGQELVIRDVSIEAKDMGSVSLRGVVGKVGRDVFDMDSSVAFVSVLGASAKSLDLTVDNGGLFERVVAREARRQKRKPEDVRREYGMAASIGIPAVLGNGPAAKTIAQAVSRFVVKPGKLTIQARAKQGGFGFADYMANPSPAGVLEALDVTATAE